MSAFGRVFGRNFRPSLARVSHDARRLAINSSAKRSLHTDHKLAEGDCAASQVKVGKNFGSDFPRCLSISGQRLGRKVTPRWSQKGIDHTLAEDDCDLSRAEVGQSSFQSSHCARHFVRDTSYRLQKLCFRTQQFLLSCDCYARTFWATFFTEVHLQGTEFTTNSFKIVLCFKFSFRFF